MTKTAAAGTMRTEEWKAQATDTAPYDEERKKGPRDVVDVSWAVGKFFFISFHFFVANKVLDINY
jgi:hypothetical protein